MHDFLRALLPLLRRTPRLESTKHRARLVLESSISAVEGRSIATRKPGLQVFGYQIT